MELPEWEKSLRTYHTEANMLIEQWMKHIPITVGRQGEIGTLSPGGL